MTQRLRLVGASLGRRHRRWAVVAAASLLATAMIGAAPAFADSGSIAGAPTVTIGQQEFGNTGSVTRPSDGCYRTYWLLPETAGDTVTIDWESQAPYTHLDVFSVGTTDYNVGNTSAFEDQTLNSNGKNELVFQTMSSGTMPLSFGSTDDLCEHPGPYDFTVYETHAMVVSLNPPSSALSGTVTAGIHNPDGGALSGTGFSVALQVSGPSVGWTTIGTAAPTAGVATISYTVPAALDGKKARFQVVGSGSGYASATSSIQTVALAAAPVVHYCVVPRVIGDRLAGAKRALSRHDCTLGTVSHRRVRRTKRGLVLSQSVAAGTQLAAGSAVGVTLGD